MKPQKEDDAEFEQPSNRPRIVTSSELLQGQKELWIEHRVDNRLEMYRLRLTATGKLYITK